MNINEMNSELQMSNLFFSSCSVNRAKVIDEGSLNFNMKKDVVQIAEHEYHIKVALTGGKDDISLSVVLEADFVYRSENEDKALENNIVNRNTVSIMFPFIRSEVTLLTSQPGMQPIVLQPVNLTNV